MKLMAMTKLKAGVAGAFVIAGVATPLVFQHQSLNQMRQENLALRQKAGELDHFREANSRLAKLQVDANEMELLRKEHSELMRLRDEVASLRRLRDELARARPERQPSQSESKEGAGVFIPAEQLADAGLVTPEAALQTFFWAALNGNKERLEEVMDTEKLKEKIRAAMQKLDPDRQVGSIDLRPSIGNIQSITNQFLGLQILSRQLSSPDEARLEVTFAGSDGTRVTNRPEFHRVGEEWRLDFLSLAEPQATSIQGDFTGKIEESKELKLVPITSK